MKVIKHEIEMLLPQFEDGVYYGKYENVCYETAYHTSKLRENLINWYPFNKESSILVISSGAGALVPYLCQNISDVTVLESDKENCNIIKARCKNFNNLTVIQEDFMSYIVPRQFDYILAIDYILAYLDDSEAGESLYAFLKKATDKLKDSGRLLIVLNNALGLKYFNGAFCDSQPRQLFSNVEQPGFFTKAEIENIFSKLKLSNYKFYYPFPEYSFPRSIYTDESCKSLKFGHHYNDYFLDRYQFFNEFKMYRMLQNNQIVDKFANSFFIELGKEKYKENNVIYAKNQYFIDKKEKIATILYAGEKKSAEKKALTSEAREHLFNLYLDSLKLNSSNHCFDYIKYTFDEKRGVLEMPYISGVSVSDQLEEKLQLFLEENGNDVIYNEMLVIFSDIYQKMLGEAEQKTESEIYSKEFQNYFGNATIYGTLYCLHSTSLDLHLDHLYPNATGYDVIDIDPVKFFNVPVDYLMWCLIESWHYTYIYNNAKLEPLLNVEKICSDLKMNVENISVFQKWRNNVYNNQSAVSQIQPFYSRKFSPAFLQYKDIEIFGTPKNTDSRVMRAIHDSKSKLDVFRINKKTPIILYGASAVGKLFYRILNQRDYKIIAFIDKRYDEIDDIQGCPVVSIDNNLNIDDCIVIVAIKNVFDHENIAKDLFRRGYKQLIYRPRKILEGGEDRELQILNDVYDEIERFKWIQDKSVLPDLDFDIPKTKEFPQITLKDNAYICSTDNKIIAHIPVLDIYTAQQNLMPDYPWAEKSILTLLPHIALYRFLWDGGEDKTKWYIDFCSYGARNNNVEITQRWSQNLIDNRLTVLAAMKKSLEQDFEFFYRNPPEGLWNDKRKYFNLNGGRHRAALFVYENFYTMPLEIEKNAYDKYLNLTVISKIEKYLQENEIDKLEVPISHPYFLNVPVKRPQYYQCVIKPIIEYLSEYELNQKGVINFTESEFLISAEDYGELKRVLYKSGFGIRNLKRESSLEKLFDELFYINNSGSVTSKINYLFLDCTLSETNFREYSKVWPKDLDTIFILANSNDTNNITEFILSNQGPMTSKIIKTSFWDSHSVVLLAFERKI